MRERTFELPVLGIVGAYLLFFILVTFPIIDLLSQALPLQWGRVDWRYGAVGMMASYLITPLMGVFLATILAFLLRHRLVLRLLSILCMFGAVFLILAMVSLGLDTLQISNMSLPENLPSPTVSGMIAGTKHMFGLFTLVLVGVGAWQASRPAPGSPAPSKAVVQPPGPGLKKIDSSED